MVGFEHCEECGKKIPKQPKPVVKRYGGRYCDECKREVFIKNSKDKVDVME